MRQGDFTKRVEALKSKIEIGEDKKQPAGYEWPIGKLGRQNIFVKLLRRTKEDYPDEAYR